MPGQKIGPVLVVALAAAFLLFPAFSFRRNDAALARSSHQKSDDTKEPSTQDPTKDGKNQGAASGGQDKSGSQPSSKTADVRFTKADSRMLSDAEMAALRDSLRWDPELVPLPPGGTAVSNLLDDQGRKLGAIRVQWIKTVAPKGAHPEPAEPPVGSFAVELENDSSCGFLAQAELDGPKESVIVSSVELDSWIGLHQPGSGQTYRVEGDAELPNENRKIVLKPLTVSSTLSACTTPKNP